MCVSVHIFKRTFCPIIFLHMIGMRPNFYDGLPPSTACLMQKNSCQIPILFAKNAPMCTWVRPSSPYYRVRIWIFQSLLAFRNQLLAQSWYQVLKNAPNDPKMDLFDLRPKCQANLRPKCQANNSICFQMLCFWYTKIIRCSYSNLGSGPHEFGRNLKIDQKCCITDDNDKDFI